MQCLRVYALKEIDGFMKCFQRSVGTRKSSQAIIPNTVATSIFHSDTFHKQHSKQLIIDVIIHKAFSPHRPVPRSPVQRQRKLSAVRGTTSARNSISMRPLGDPPMVMSKNTTGF
mmetsp:Transcript_21393/g.31562  ORF Transcript_21393/g.31562 Transcript_21393/m.31562 type:complete len:115 (+) Transcript_21393:879-1223(+)